MRFYITGINRFTEQLGVLAAYDLDDDNTVTVVDGIGDERYAEELRAGIPVINMAAGEIQAVTPDMGAAFHDACRGHFNGPFGGLVSQAAYEEFQHSFFAKLGGGHRSTLPPAVA